MNNYSNNIREWDQRHSFNSNNRKIVNNQFVQQIHRNIYKGLLYDIILCGVVDSAPLLEKINGFEIKCNNNDDNDDDDDNNMAITFFTDKFIPFLFFFLSLKILHTMSSNRNKYFIQRNRKQKKHTQEKE